MKMFSVHTYPVRVQAATKEEAIEKFKKAMAEDLIPNTEFAVSEDTVIML